MAPQSRPRALDLPGALTRNRTVAVSGASVAQHLLRARKLGEIQVSVAPVLLGGGVRRFDHFGPESITLEQTRVIESVAVTHLRYRVVYD